MSVNLLIIGIAVLGLFSVILVSLFFISRRSQKVMQSLLLIMTKPERAKVIDASRVLRSLLAGEISRIEANFLSMQQTLASQISAANELKEQLSVKNNQLVELADNSVKKMAMMSSRLDSTLAGLNSVVSSNDWINVQDITEKFSSRINMLCEKVDSTYQDTLDKVSVLQDNIESWLESSDKLHNQLTLQSDENINKMSGMTNESENIRVKLEELSKSVSDGFNNVKASAADYKDLMENHDSMLSGQLDKMDEFTKQSNKLLNTQMNTITNTANAVGGQVRLVESSIEKQIKKLTDAVEMLMDSAVGTESSVKNVSSELSGLTNRFHSEIKEFTDSIVSNLDKVSTVANGTLENTKTSANAFSDSVRTMATGVRETLMEMNTAHNQLSGQSKELIKVSEQTTKQLQPLSELIEKYYKALPELSHGSAQLAENLEKIVISLNERISSMQQIVEQSVDSISDSSSKLNSLSGQSRQQMIDLMSDYAKAAETMQSLHKQMMIARAHAPMDAIKVPVSRPVGRISSTDLIRQSEKMFEKIHEQSVDLVNSTGADVPDSVWKKYHDGDKTIFTKWFAKILENADKKQIKQLLKSDNVFNSQTKQFIRSFDKILSAAGHANDSERLIKTLLSTELGKVYNILNNLI